MDHPSSKYFRCVCGGEVLCVIDDNGQYELSIFRQRSRSIWSRLRMCYQVLRHGEPYSDDIILDTQAAIELAKFLQRKK